MCVCYQASCYIYIYLVCKSKVILYGSLRRFKCMYCVYCLKFGTYIWYLWTFLSLAHTWFIAETLDFVCDWYLTRATSQCKNGDHSSFYSLDTCIGVWLYVAGDIWLLALLWSVMHRLLSTTLPAWKTGFYAFQIAKNRLWARYIVHFLFSMPVVYRPHPLQQMEVQRLVHPRLLQ